MLAYNVQSRLLDSNWAPHLVKLSGFSRIPLALLGGLVPVLLLAFAYRFVSRPPHVAKPMTAASETAAPLSPTSPAAPPEAIRTAPSYASVEPEGEPNTGSAPMLIPVSRQQTFDASRSTAAAAADQTMERAATHPKQPIPAKTTLPGNRHFATQAKAALPVRPPAEDPFTAELPHSAFKLVAIREEADQPAPVSFDLKPVAKTVVAEQNTELVNPDEAIKTDGRWYHGRTNKYIRLTTNSPTNTLLFSKEFELKRTSWRVNLDGNTITYTLDAKGISIEKHIDAHDSTERIKTELSNAASYFDAYAVVVKLEKNDVIIARPDGTRLHTTHTEDHDWSQAGVFANPKSVPN